MKKSKQYLFLAGLVVAVLGITGALMWYRHSQIFSLEKAMNDTAYSVDGEDVTLQQCMYYIMIVEDDVNDKALIYDKENPRAYWNLYINNKFVSREAAKTALNYAIRDDLLAREAKQNGIEITSQQEEDADMTGKEIYQGLTRKQADATHLTEEELVAITRKRSLVNTYCLYLAEKNQVEQTESALNEAYGLDSDYYTELKETYQVIVNETLWDQISLGDITIN